MKKGTKQITLKCYSEHYTAFHKLLEAFNFLESKIYTGRIIICDDFKKTIKFFAYPLSVSKLSKSVKKRFGVIVISQ